VSDKPISLIQAPEGYTDWLVELKIKVHHAQQRATLAVNHELIALYWQIGHAILARQADQGWGAKVIERLAHDLRTTFPDMKGFSPRNLKYMRAFAGAWPDAESVSVAAIAANDYNLSVSSYVEAKDNREVVDITQLNAALKSTVAKIDKLRTDIDAIVSKIEGEEAEA
jgi:hypothetical protein